MIALTLIALASLPPISPHYDDAARHASDPPAVYVVPAQTFRPSALTENAPRPHKRVYGFLPYWVKADPNAFKWDVLTDVIYFAAEVGGQGQILKSYGWLPSGAAEAPIARIAHQNGARAHLAAFVPGNIRGLLASPAARTAAVRGLVDLAVRGKADGLNLDIEPVPEEQRAEYLAFVREVRAALGRALPGAELTVCVYAVPWYYPGYDLPELARLSDALLVMSYNYYWKGSAVAGPVAPLQKGTLWNLSVADSFENSRGHFSFTTPDKLVMGVSYFGHDWPVESATDYPSKNTGYGSAIEYRNVVAKIPAGGARWEDQSQTPFYGYRAGTTSRQLWYDDRRSLEAKYEYVNQKGLAGVMIWALGYDEGRPELWEALRQKFVRERPPPPPVVQPPPPSPTPTPVTPPAAQAPGVVPETAVPLSGEPVEGGGCSTASGSALGWGLLLVVGTWIATRRQRPSTR